MRKMMRSTTPVREAEGREAKANVTDKHWVREGKRGTQSGWRGKKKPASIEAGGKREVV